MDKSFTVIEKHKQELYDIVKLYMWLKKIKLYHNSSNISTIIFGTRSNETIIDLSFGFWPTETDGEDDTFNIKINDRSQFYLSLHNKKVCLTDQDDGDYTIIYNPLNDLIGRLNSIDGLSLPKLTHMLRKEWINLLI